MASAAILDFERLLAPISEAEPAGVEMRTEHTQAFFDIKNLRDSKLGPARILELLEFRAIREKFNLKPSEIGRIEGWIRATHIRWGLDAEDRARSGMPAFDENTWRAGIYYYDEPIW